jgi:hypothetical protein
MDRTRPSAGPGGILGRALVLESECTGQELVEMGRWDEERGVELTRETPWTTTRRPAASACAMTG